MRQNMYTNLATESRYNRREIESSFSGQLKSTAVMITGFLYILFLISSDAVQAFTFGFVLGYIVLKIGRHYN